MYCRIFTMTTLVVFVVVLSIVSTTKSAFGFHVSRKTPTFRVGGCPTLKQQQWGIRGSTIIRRMTVPLNEDSKQVSSPTAAASVVEDEEECDFVAMLEMHDECMTHKEMPHSIPTASIPEYELEKMVHCAEVGSDCSVAEMTDMIEELERLNIECEGVHSRECNLPAVEARNILKVALASQASMITTSEQLPLP